MPEKVPRKAHLVPTKKVIRGKTKAYQAIRYISPTETKKRVQKLLESRKKESYLTRAMKARPYNTDILYQEELMKVIPPNPKGERYYTGSRLEGVKKVSVNVKLIRHVVEFKEPVEGCVSIVERNDGAAHVRQYLNDRIEKKTNTKFSRIKNIGKKLEDHRGRYKKLLQSDVPEKQELGVVLALIDRYQMRIGGGPYGIEEKEIKVESLKPGMVVRHELWKEAVPPHQVVWNKEKTKYMLRNLNTKEDHPIPAKYKEFTRLGHYGATTLEGRHVRVSDSKLLVDVIGKSGVWQVFEITDKDLAAILTRLKEGRRPLDKMFPNVKRTNVTVITDKLKVRPHDFRAYHTTKGFVEESKNFPVPTTKKELKSIEKQILEKVSTKLWNKPGTAKKAYLDPVVRSSWEAGLLSRIGKGKGKVKKSLFVIVPAWEDMKLIANIMSIGEVYTKSLG